MSVDQNLKRTFHELEEKFEESTFDSYVMLATTANRKCYTSVKGAPETLIAMLERLKFRILEGESKRESFENEQFGMGPGCVN